MEKNDQNKQDRNEVLQEINEERERDLVGAINWMKIAFFDHNSWHNKFLKFIFEGKVLEKKTRGKPRIRFLEYAQQIMKCQNYYEMKRIAEKK